MRYNARANLCNKQHIYYAMSHTRWDYATLMRERGFRVTPQRQLILDAICAGGGHTTLEEIYARVHTKSAAINRATVYRTLDFLCKLRLVVGADVGEGHMVYEIAGDTPHHHLVCHKCRRSQEVKHEAVDELFIRLEREYGFRVDTDHLALFGLCAHCYEAECQAGRDPVARPPAPVENGDRHSSLSSSGRRRARGTASN
jgi:Fur family transcriptional regulator, ferric uptake regulator